MKKQRILWQRLARAVTEGTAIRADKGTESTEWVEKKRFPGKTSDLSRNAKAVASETEEHKNGQGKVSFWTDG